MQDIPVMPEPPDKAAKLEKKIERSKERMLQLKKAMRVKNTAIKKLQKRSKSLRSARA